MERRTSSETLGCGSSHSSEITLNIQTTTGGNFSITVENSNSVDQLKKIVSKKLKVSKDRICLLHRERQLRDGTLEDNGLLDGSRVILLPSVETGLLTQRPENSVMQALESLNDSQVNDFLSGKSPLNLTMRLGDHMMLIQLQLSTLNPVTTYPSGSATTKARTPAPTPASRTPSRHSASSSLDQPKPASEPPPDKCSQSSESVSSDSPSTSKNVKSPILSSESTKQTTTHVETADELKAFLRKQDIETLQNAFEIFKSLAEMQEDIDKDSDDTSADSSDRKSDSCSSKYSFRGDGSVDTSSGSDLSFEEQSPIKSLSNLVSSPLKSSLQPSYSPLDVSGNKKVGTLNMEDKPPPPAVPPPKYVPLPSSLKNNLIESIVEDLGNSDKSKNPDKPVSGPIITDPIAANLTSCLCSTLNPDYVCASNCHPSAESSKVDNSILMETDYIEEPSHLIADNPSDDYPMENLFNNAVDQGLFKKMQEEQGYSKLPASSESNKKKEHLHICSLHGPTLPLSAFTDVSESTKNKRLHYLLHKTSKQNNPITQSKQKAFMQSLVNKQLKKKMHQTLSNMESADHARPSTSKQDMTHSSSSSNHFDTISEPSTSKSSDSTESSTLFRIPIAPSPVKSGPQSAPSTSSSVSDTKALIEASKNLTQTLKKLSKEVLTSKVDLANEESARSKIGQGAVIESMKHHGKGIYSGTFSGTLNPALQDRFGRPKRDISTIIHILNDLLCATPPQYRRGARITFEPTHNTQSSRTRQRETRQQGNCSAECGCSKCHSTPGKCPYGECNGHPSPGSSETGASAPAPCACKAAETVAGEAEACSCTASRLVPHNTQVKKCQSCTGKDKDDKSKKSSVKSCRKCHTASSLALDNSKTKCKLEQLRLVMQQKKQRRDARKMKSAPYVTSGSSVAIVKEAPNILAEEIDTLA